MPAYGASSTVTALYPGDSKDVIVNETPLTNYVSERAALYQDQQGVGGKLSVEIVFNAAPGAFEYDVQTSDTDVSANFVTEAAGAIAAVNANNVARLELNNVFAKFARLLCKTQNANAVQTNRATITRQ